MLMLSLQSRQGQSILTVLPGNSQQTASASGPQTPNHFCSPSTEILNGVGMSEKGLKVAIQSVSGFSLIPAPVAPAKSSQGSGQSAVVRGLSCVYQATYDDVIGFIEGLSVGHGSPLNDD